MAIVVSILSEQLIPNVLFIKQMASIHDSHIFLSTTKMEDDCKSSILAATLGLAKEEYKVPIIDANSPALILEVLDNFDWPKGTPYIVNITGGTKMMSQMAYIYFSGNQNTTIYYWPIGSEFLEQLHPVIEEIKIPTPYQLDLNTYIAAHGYDYTCEQNLSHPFSKAASLFKNVIKYGSPENVPEIRIAKDDAYRKLDKQYFLGGWFEEWMFTFLKESLHLPDSQIAFNLKLKSRQSVRNTESDNEIDVAFVHKNKLYIWECKVYYSKQLRGNKIAEVIYKISSVSQSLGLQATSLVTILSPFGFDNRRKNFLNDITKLMRIKKVFSLEDMADEKKFISQIKTLINYG